MSKERLHRGALALVQLKGGSGKTDLTANLAAIAASRDEQIVVVIDADANATFTGAALGNFSAETTLTQALERTSRHASITDLLTYTPSLGIYLLKGDIRGVPKALAGCFPELVAALKQTKIETATGVRPVDYILVDPPGENREMNAWVLAAVDWVAIPALIAAPDLAALQITLQLVAQAQRARGGRPVFLGIIPNRVTRKGAIERLLLEAIVRRGKLLPYIPASDTLRATFTRSAASGGEAVISFAPRSKLAGRLALLWDEMNSPHTHPEDYAHEFCEYIGAPLPDLSEEKANAEK